MMAGFLIMQDGDEFQFHVGSFPEVNPRDVTCIQLDCDELDKGLDLWPNAELFTGDQGRVMSWHGASARRFVCKFLDHHFAYDRGAIK